jgi:hypothetical protein
MGTTKIHGLATSAAELLDDFFIHSSSSSQTTSSFLPLIATKKKPLIGIMDNSAVDHEVMELFGTVTHYPALKFILTFPDKNQNDDAKMDGDEYVIHDYRTDHKIHLWDYIGPKATAKQMFDSVVLYWYRFVVTHSFLGHVKSSIDDADDESHVMDPPIFTFSSQNDMTSFLRSHGDRLLRPSQARRKHASKLESEVFHFYMGMEEGGEVGGIFHDFEFLDEETAALRTQYNEIDKNDDAPPGSSKNSAFTQEIDPYVIIVQCRSTIDFGAIHLTKISVEELIHLNKERKAMKDFEELAAEMAHRSDVAFFALNATEHNGNNVSGEVCGGLFGEVEDSLAGVVAFVKIRRFVEYTIDEEPRGQDAWDQYRRRVILGIKTDWNEINLVSSPHALFFPAAETKPEQSRLHDGKYAVKNPLTAAKYVRNTLVASAIVHTTPTVIWFDKDRVSQLAFPWYRKVHAVLFVDMGLAYKVQEPESVHRPPWPESLNNSTEAGLLLMNQQKAIRMFYDAALQHRLDRPSDDVVFLIVPSSEIRIMMAFGIDIWTPLDDDLFGTQWRDRSTTIAEESSNRSTDSNYCSHPETNDIRSILPVMMITDSSGRHGKKSSTRYYLCSHDIAKKTMQKGGAIGKFINEFFNGTIGQPFVRSGTVRWIPKDQPNTNKPNVTELTGNTFESLVMDRDDEHTMLLLESNSCGHCKRFSVFWNELSSLVQAMNWSSVINVMKIDVSSNDVPHDMVDAWDLPSVYYFPAHEKNQPIELELPTPTLIDSDPQQSDEGLAWVTCGYDIVKWMVDQGKLDVENLLRLDGSAAMPHQGNFD